MNDLFVSIEYNDRQLIGLEELKNELDGKINYQLSPKWIPACSEGAEVWISIFVNSNITDFIKSVLISGFLYDFIKDSGKNYFFKPLFTALENLNTNNQEKFNGLKVLKLKFKFDDCDIYIGGINKSLNSIIPRVFEVITKLKPKLEQVFSGLEVIKIELPIIYENYAQETENNYFIDIYPEEIRLENFMNLWQITYQTNYPIMIYDFKRKILFNKFNEKEYYSIS